VSGTVEIAPPFTATPRQSELASVANDTAARVILGELLRLPRYPAAIARGLAAVLSELPAILRLRRELRPRRDVFSAMLEGRPA